MIFAYSIIDGRPHVCMKPTEESGEWTGIHADQFRGDRQILIPLRQKIHRTRPLNQRSPDLGRGFVRSDVYWAYASVLHCIQALGFLYFIKTESPSRALHEFRFVDETSFPPSSGVMNPKPFSVLKNFTLPLGI